MKIVLFGDSLTEGSYGGSYARHLARLMPEHTFINAGVGGDTVVHLLRRVERDVLAHQPDAVFVMVGGNDALSHTFPAVRSYFRGAKRLESGSVSPDVFARELRELYTQLQLAHIVTWVGLEPNEYNPAAAEAHTAYNHIAADAARAFGLPVLDLAATFPAPHPLPDRPPLDIAFILTIGSREARGWAEYEGARAAGGFTFSFDGLHLTPEAAEQAADAIARFMRAHGA